MSEEFASKGLQLDSADDDWDSFNFWQLGSRNIRRFLVQEKKVGLFNQQNIRDQKRELKKAMGFKTDAAFNRELLKVLEEKKQQTNLKIGI